jgi:hypothetical protein
MACTCCRRDESSTYIRSPIQRGVVSVCYVGSTLSVRLSALNVRRESGRRLVALSDVWWAASLPLDPARLRMDFVGDDGFETAKKCGPPLLGAALESGFIDVDTRDLSWTIEVPCFYRVKGLAALVGRVHVPAIVGVGAGDAR